MHDNGDQLSDLKDLEDRKKKKRGRKMPGLISVRDFVREVREDFSSPTTSNFVNRIPQCRETVTKLEEVGKMCVCAFFTC